MRSEYNSIFFPLKYGVGIMKFQLPRIFTLFRVFPPLLGHSDLYMTGTVNQISARGRSYQLMLKVLQLVG